MTAPLEVAPTFSTLELHGFVSRGFILSIENEYLAAAKQGSLELSEVGFNLTQRTFSPQLDWFHLNYRRTTGSASASTLASWNSSAGRCSATSGFIPAVCGSGMGGLPFAALPSPAAPRSRPAREGGASSSRSCHCCARFCRPVGAALPVR